MAKRKTVALEPISPAEVALNGLKKIRADIDLQIAALEATIPSRNNGKGLPKNFKAFDPTPLLKKMGRLP